MDSAESAAVHKARLDPIAVVLKSVRRESKTPSSSFEIARVKSHGSLTVVAFQEIGAESHKPGRRIMAGVRWLNGMWRATGGFSHAFDPAAVDERDSPWENWGSFGADGLAVVGGWTTPEAAYVEIRGGEDLMSDEVQNNVAILIGAASLNLVDAEVVVLDGRGVELDGSSDIFRW